jgi:hypothetical protein
MTWLGLAVSADQRDVIDLVTSISAELVVVDDLDGRTEAIKVLVEAGLWTIGLDEEVGGSGASLPLALTALAALAPHSTGLAWGIAQVHAAVEILAGDARFSWLVEDIVSARRPVCVVDNGADRVRLQVDGNRLYGSLERLDITGDSPYVVVLAGDSAAWVLSPETLKPGQALQVSGMSGAVTLAANVNAVGEEGWWPVDGVPAKNVRARLSLAGAAIASGLSLQAAQWALEYSRQRIQFGGPLIALPTVRQSLAIQAARSAQSWMMLFADNESLSRSALILHDNCERAIEVAAAAVQSHGGYGYLSEYPVERILRDALSLRSAVDAAGTLRMAADLLAPERPSYSPRVEAEPRS